MCLFLVVRETKRFTPSRALKREKAHQPALFRPLSATRPVSYSPLERFTFHCSRGDLRMKMRERWRHTSEAL